MIDQLTHPLQGITIERGYTLLTDDTSVLEGRWDRTITVTTDAEWSNELDTQPLNGRLKDTYRAKFLTTQFSWHEDGNLCGLVIWHPSYALPETVNIPELHTLYVLQGDPETVNPLTLGMMGKSTKMHLLMFYAPHDVRGVVGTDIWVPWLLGPDHSKGYESFKGFSGTVTKKRKMNGKLVSQNHGEINLVDVIGTCTAGMNLDSFHSSVGIESPYKHLSDNWDKAHMEYFISGDPESFIKYAIGDVLYLERGMSLRVSQVNQMIIDALGFNPNYVEPWKRPDRSKGETRFPMSAGLLVSTTMELWLEQHPTYNRVLTALLPFTEYATKEGQALFEATVLGPLLNQTPGTWKGKELTNYDPAHPLTSLPNRDGWTNDADVLESYHPLSSSSVPAQVFYHSGRNSTGVLNAIVYGGRCVNECPDRHRIDNVLDIDLNSCYGSALADFTYPVGFPRVLKYASSDTNRMTLGKFLKRYGDELVDNCYQVYVTGTLPFKQDLVASKLGVNERDIIKKLFIGWDDGKEYDGGYSNDQLGRDIDKAHIPGDMVHLLKECVHSVITSDILGAIRSVSSEQELKGWMSLEVETATYYARSDRHDCIESFETTCRAHTPMKFEGTTPITPRAWFPVSMSEFVGSMVKTRKTYKRAKVQDGDLNDLLQNGMKLFINTTYGCMASPFFRMGSTVLANNITAKARLGAWMMAKALGSVQSITDGGMYSVNQVRIITTKNGGRKPGFNVLSDYSKTNSHRGISTGPMELGPYTWKFDALKTALHHESRLMTEWLESKVLNHINRFWGNYGMALPFSIEHKYKNTCDRASYDGSANYLMIGAKSKQSRVWGGVKYPYTFKCRGAKDYNGQPHAKEVLLWVYAEVIPLEQLLINPDGLLQQATSKQNKLIQVTDFQRHHIEFIRAGLLPGDSRDEVQVLRPNELHRLCDTAQDYHRVQDAHRKATAKHDKELDTLGYIGRQFGLTLNPSPIKRGTLGRNFPTFYKRHTRRPTQNPL